MGALIIDSHGNKIFFVHGQRYGWLRGWQHAYPIISGPHATGQEPAGVPLLKVAALWYAYTLDDATPMTE